MTTLKAVRRARGLTQAQLAQAARVDQRLISRLETGQVKEPGYRAVIRICRALGVEPATIAEFRLPEDAA